MSRGPPPAGPPLEEKRPPPAQEAEWTPGDFGRREATDYSHSYTYLGGGLGRDEVKEKRQKGKTSLPPDGGQHLKSEERKAEIRKMAQTIQKSQHKSHLRKFFWTKDKERFAYLEEPESSDDEEHPRKSRLPAHVQAEQKYFYFCQHCLSRNVDVLKYDKPILAASSASAPASQTWAGPSETSGNSSNAPPSLYRIGALVEVTDLEKATYLNGRVGNVQAYFSQERKYDVLIIGLDKTFRIKEDNLMFATHAGEDQNKHKTDEPVIGDIIPLFTAVLAKNLVNAKVFNGMTGKIVQLPNEAGRYEVLFGNKARKLLKEENLQLVLPEGWEEFLDESVMKPYYRHKTSQEVTWVHPVFMKKNKISTSVEVETGPSLKQREKEERAFEQNIFGKPAAVNHDSDQELEDVPVSKPSTGAGPASKQTNFVDKLKTRMLNEDDASSEVARKPTIEGWIRKNEKKINWQTLSEHLDALMSDAKIVEADNPYPEVEWPHLRMRTDILAKLKVYKEVTGEPTPKRIRWDVEEETKFKLDFFKSTLFSFRRIIRILMRIKKNRYALKQYHEFFKKLLQHKENSEWVDEVEWMVGILATF